MKNSYESLVNQYNRLISRYKDLETQKKDKEEAWKVQLAKTNVTYSKIKALCKKILAKEANIDFLGKVYSWDALPIDELIEKASITFENYNASRTQMELELQKHFLEARETIDNMSVAYAALQNQVKDITERLESDPGGVIEEQEREQIKENLERTINPPKKPKVADAKAREAMENDTIEVVIMNEDEDVSVDDLRQQAEMAEINTELRLADGKPIVKASEKVKKTMQTVTDNTVIVANGGMVPVDVDEICEKLSDRRKQILEMIGRTGLFLSTDILEELGKIGEVKQSNFRNDIFTLKVSGLIMVTPISVPILCQHGNVYELTPSGAAVYHKLYGKEAVPSQSRQIIKDHDNLEHGLGIMTLAKILERFEIFNKMTTARKDNTIVLDTGDKYIPDIIVQTKKYTAYFEYELATHTQADFNIKMNKMCRKTRFLNIVTNSAANADNLSKKVIKWVKSRGDFGCLPTHIVRITTLTKLNFAADNQKNYLDRDNWVYWYDLGKPEEEQIQV